MRPKALISVTVAVLGIGIAAYFWFRREQTGPLHGLTQRNALARAGYTFLEKKYYLDVLYETCRLAVKEMMPFAKGVSAKSHDCDKQGNETKTDYTRMLQIVLDAGYRGYVGIEYEGGKLSEPEGIRATKRLLEEAGARLS